jgi:hypothetical protein
MDRLQRVIFKFEMGQAEDLEPYEVILRSDREPDAFASPKLYELFADLPETIQKKIQVGSQMVNALAHKPILIGAYSRAHFGEYQEKLPWDITFVTSKFEWFIQERLMPLARYKGLTLCFSEAGDSVLISKYACRVVSDSRRMIRYGEPQLERVLGSNLLVANWYY